LRRVEDGLDRAVVSGLSDVRIIHGVGRGILREAIARALREHPSVADSRLGEQGEGGRGVTIAHLR
jgi:DNA mismatch repair protein MutS2